jgi:hypothetical protein
VARHRQRQDTPRVLLHQRQCQIDRGGHAGRSPDRTVAHEDRVRLHPDGRIAPGELGTMHPVRRRAPAFQQACRGEQEGAGADRSGSPRPPRPCPHPAQQRPIGGGRMDTRTAGDQQRVERRPRRRQSRGHEPQPGGGGHDWSGRRHHARRIERRLAVPRRKLVGGGEDLQRPGDVEQLHPRIGEELDQPRRPWQETRGLWHFRHSLPS